MIIRHATVIATKERSNTTRLGGEEGLVAAALAAVQLEGGDGHVLGQVRHRAVAYVPLHQAQPRVRAVLRREQPPIAPSHNNNTVDEGTPVVEYTQHNRITHARAHAAARAHPNTHCITHNRVTHARTHGSARK